ncbi:type I restriction enzyme S subunit [Brevibacterium sanguinis]|uniref:Type I restriction enzyme S subunit n=2 Tax=Brevibacterium TaxID=1696 RepID=A0A366IE06_9MICO|nr:MULTISPECIES: restriction endonuclease subunit S [Brevibacterium]RBP62775.1 type I restriction enzyme S subunit [Brevibacterium sanguinis]RBP69340.1 type I restriction enzyme S subunit [Brevibacterium celere]
MKMVPLGEVASIDTALIKPTEISGDTYYLGLEHIEKSSRRITPSTSGKAGITSTKHKFNRNQILYGKLRPNLAKIATPDFDGVCSTDILPITPSGLVDRAYLYYFLSWSPTVSKVASKATGANLPRIKPSALAEVRIPLPPVDEQRRIAEILDKADAIRQKRRQTIAHLTSLHQSIFHDMFAGFNEYEQLGNLFSVSSGSTPDRRDPSFFGGSIPWVKTGEVDGRILDTEEKVTQSGRESAGLKLHPAGSLIIAMYGQGKTRGRAAILGIPATTNQACAVLPPSSEINSQFVLTQLRIGYERLRSSARGGNQANLNLNLIRSFTIKIAPLNLQDEFETRSSLVEGQIDMARAAYLQSDHLFASLQSRAFRGEL